MSADIFAGQPTDADLLAELYDLEHDEMVEDLPFYREMARRARGPVLDVGCGSGRLFRAYLDGGARRVVGVDGSAALLRRAERRIAADRRLAQAAAEGRLRLLRGDARRLDRAAVLDALKGRAGLGVVAGVVPHLDGPEEALEMLDGARRALAPEGLLVLDDVGPGLLPSRDLPLSVDWRRTVDGREVVRRSQLVRREAPEGLRVAFSTIVDLGQPDGTIARLPASHRLWYPTLDVLTTLVRQAGLALELAYGSHDLEGYGEDSERRILVVRPVVGTRRRQPGWDPGRVEEGQRGS